MPKVSKRPQALIDLAEQADYIAEDNLDRALRFLEAADATFQFLADNPALGSPCDFENPEAAGIRRWRVRGFEKHLIFYRPTEDGVDIARVLHGSRDVERIFADAPESEQ